MPELPEVETIRLGLLPLVKGKELAQVKALWPKALQNSKGKELSATQLKGLKIKDIRRRGKVLMLDLDGDNSLLVHLKMTGQLVVEPSKGRRFAGGHPTKSMAGRLPDSSTRVAVTFTDGSKLFFNDQRKFGWMRLVPATEVDEWEFLKKMGPEPLGPNFLLKDFAASITRRKAPIKAVLLDQTTLAGMGNIYVDESLHLAKIHPSRLANSLKTEEVEKLHSAIRQVLKAALGYGGTSFTNYINALGVKGNYLDYARVFRREGQKCPVCGTTIEKTRVAGRGTHFCPKCQKI